MLQFNSLHLWLEWLESSHPVTDIELGLARISKVAELLSLKQPEVPVISVAGTNGKGSVVATLESLANHHQLNIGSYTSPHLVKFNERIKVNGEPVSDEVLCQAFEYIANAKGDTELTYFEFTTLVALYCFSQESLDFIALEVGLGGRLDAVNVINADASVITSIGLDHTDWLGSTLDVIAYEKAGIARAGKPLIVADKQLLPLLTKAIAEIQPSLISEGKDYKIEQADRQWSYSSKQLSLNNIPKSSLLVTNQAAALTAFLQIFPDLNDKNALTQSLSKASLTGRFSQLSKDPCIILDVAHNPDSASSLNQHLAKWSKSDSAQVWAICGMLSDKDIISSLSQMKSIDNWLCIDLEHPRGAKASEVQTVVKQNFAGADTEAMATISQAYDYFRENAEESDLLVVFGSFVTVGLMLEYWQRIHAS